MITLGARAHDNGNTVPALSTAHLKKRLIGPFLFYVPDVQVAGGSIGVAGIIPYGAECGHLFALFAISVRIGRFQVGVAGVYAAQVEDDKVFGARVPPDDRRAEVLNLGGVLNFDMTEHRAAVKIRRSRRSSPAIPSGRMASRSAGSRKLY